MSENGSAHVSEERALLNGVFIFTLAHVVDAQQSFTVRGVCFPQHSRVFFLRCVCAKLAKHNFYVTTA